MPGPDIAPDPDLRFAESGAGEKLRAAATKLLEQREAIQKQISGLSAANAGDTVEKQLDELNKTKVALDTSAEAMQRTAQLQEELADAAKTYRNDAPTPDDIRAAWAAVEQARSVEAAARERGDGYGAESRALSRAKFHLLDLQRKREAAIAAFEEARDAALERAQSTDGGWGESRKEKPSTPSTPTAPAPKSGDSPAAPAPAAAASGGAGAPGGSELPSAATLPPPGTSLSGTPETAPASSTGTGGGLDPAKAAAVAGLLGQAQQAAPQQQAQPQPQMAMPAMAPTAQQPKPATNSGVDQGLLDLVNALDAAAAPAGAALISPSLSSASPSSTMFSSPSVSSPGISPITPSPALSATPAINPIVTGTSTAGLVTDTNVTGRPDNAPPRTATSPASHLAGATAAAAAEPAGAGARGAAGTGAGAPMMPMMPPMMGGPGMGGAGKERETVKAEQSSEEFLLTGGPAVAEAVPGGTIAQRRED